MANKEWKIPLDQIEYGTVMWFHEKGSWGFAKPDKGGERIFIHISSGCPTTEETDDGWVIFCNDNIDAPRISQRIIYRKTQGLKKGQFQADPWAIA